LYPAVAPPVELVVLMSTEPAAPKPTMGGGVEAFEKYYKH
jgi:hypothetical protein